MFHLSKNHSSIEKASAEKYNEYMKLSLDEIKKKTVPILKQAGEATFL